MKLNECDKNFFPKWNQKNISEVIFKIEKNNNLLDGKSYNSLLWERTRTWLIREINSQLGMYENAHDKVKNEGAIKRLIRLLKYSIISNPFLIIKKPEYIFFSHQRRKLNADGLYECLYTDPLRSILDNEKFCISIEKDHQKQHLRPAESKNLKYLDFIDLIVLIKKIFYKKKSKIDKKFFKDVQKQICDEFNIEINIFKRLKSVEKKYNLYFSVYRALFKYLKPEIVFFVCSYGKENIVSAAKSLGIRTVEIQHGVITSMHLGYSFPGGLKKKSFPDYFLSFGEYWGKYVEFPISKEKIIPVGYSYLTGNIKEFATSSKENKVVFISQGTIGKQLSIAACKYAETNKENYEIIYKLHPGEYLRWKKEYRELYLASTAGLIKVVDSDKPSLYSIFASSKYAIGVYSTALFEALTLKCKVLIVKLPGHDYMLDLIESGYVDAVEPEKDIVFSKLKKDFDEDLFFKQDYKTAFLNAIKIIEKQ